MIPLELRPYAKAVLPAALTLIAVVGQWIATGEFSRTELATAVTGGLSALVTLSVSNGAALHIEDLADSPDADTPDERPSSDPELEE